MYIYVISADPISSLAELQLRGAEPAQGLVVQRDAHVPRIIYIYIYIHIYIYI